jgi:hypothetical protein
MRGAAFGHSLARTDRATLKIVLIARPRLGTRCPTANGSEPFHQYFGTREIER